MGTFKKYLVGVATYKLQTGGKRIMKTDLLKSVFAVVFCVSVAVADGQWKWTAQEFVADKAMRSVVWGGGKFVAVGDGGATMASPDGKAWVVGNSGTVNNLRSVTWHDGLFVAAGDGGTIVTSGNGVEWTVRQSGKNYKIVSAVWGNGKYAALTYTDATYDMAFSILMSNDAIMWTEFDMPMNWILPVVGKHEYKNFAYIGGMFIVGEVDGDVKVSSDCVSWEPNVEFDFLPPMSDLDPCGPPFVIVPADPMHGNREVLSIAYGNEMFLALGESGGLARSENGKDWSTLERACGKSTVNGRTVIHNGAHFLIAGEGGIYKTVDGTNPEKILEKSWKDRVSIAYNSSVYVTVYGTEVGILEPPTVSIASFAKPAKHNGVVMNRKGNVISLHYAAAQRANTKPEIDIYSIAGKRLKITPSFGDDGKVSIPLSNLATGIYIIRASYGKERWQEQFSVK